ncbi:MAG TPA: hypothetical protein VFV50_17460, partial [Bdellovibrionales bacterium]|nr:hypothetical protein [Bdellovibrionales bacterium]
MKNLAKAALVGCLLTTSLFLAGAADAQTPARLTARQVRELGYWGGRYPDLAKLANPPIGSVRPELRKLEKLVREIVATMYPTAFKDFQLTVSIYPTQKPAIFVVQPEWPLTGEEPRSPFLHKLLGFDAKKPMYELGIGLGLVNKLETVDQLAFVIGREVARLYDGQVEERPDREKLSAWWGAQAHESVSDFKSVEKMLGKYDLEAAVQALVRLSEQFTEKPHDVIAMLIAGFDGKQHEGVRISQTQAHVGYLRRVSADAQPRRQVPLPPEAHIYKNPREVAMPMHTPETLAQAERYVQQFITRVLLKNEPYGALDLGFFGSSNEDSPYKKFNMKYPPFRRPKLEDLQRIMYQGVDRIMSSRVSVQTKGNALLQFMISMGQAQTFLRPEFNKKSKLFLERHANQALARPFVVAILRLKEQGWDPKLTTDLYFKGQSEVSIMKASRPNSMVSDMNSGVLVGSAFLAALSRFETGRTIIGELVRSDLTRFPGETVERTSNFLQHMMNVGPIQRVEEDEKKFLEVAAESNKIIARSIIPLITPEILREALGLNTGTPTPEQRQHWSEFLRIHERAVEYNYPAYFIATVKETVDEIHKFAAGEKARIFAQLR